MWECILIIKEYHTAKGKYVLYVPHIQKKKEKLYQKERKTPFEKVYIDSSIAFYMLYKPQKLIKWVYQDQMVWL